MTDRDTKEKIMDAAEQLFGANGIEATSLRAITQAAGVNLAAVNYHFGSKESLIEATFARRIAPINQERLMLMDGLTVDSTVEDILETFLAPTVKVFKEHPAFVRFAGRVFLEPESRLHRWFPVLFAEVARRFASALQRGLPDVPPGEIFWRMHFVIGAMINTMFKHAEFASMPMGASLGFQQEKDMLRKIVDRLITFGAAGMRAPVAPRQETRP